MGVSLAVRYCRQYMQPCSSATRQSAAGNTSVPALLLGGPSLTASVIIARPELYVVLQRSCAHRHGFAAAVESLPGAHPSARAGRDPDTDTLNC
ncbi:hypothetical protein DOTSEDRAFT_68377 [Dothistroma septosporum NZE10]|uniref:Uncharacterized protein n=1 Tax=Dothistroma septosporum (strain NZE10 / CBS 128990) TaxID=675120 RepID=N1Q1H2_DOTSN|nr:hypothetical protein DOTSEDRAFT_68377 [Dothistroma septosporum NZE10]